MEGERQQTIMCCPPLPAVRCGSRSSCFCEMGGFAFVLVAVEAYGFTRVFADLSEACLVGARTGSRL